MTREFEPHSETERASVLCSVKNHRPSEIHVIPRETAGFQLTILQYTAVVNIPVWWQCVCARAPRVWNWCKMDGLSVR